MEDDLDLDQRIAEAVWWAANTDDYQRRIRLLRQAWEEYLRRKYGQGDGEAISSG